MHQFWEKIEHFNARLIPFALIGLLFVIVVELFFHEFAEHYHLLIFILDSLVIAIFVVDLIFLGVRAKNVRYFFRHYWLDLVAVFPFSLLFSLVSYVYELFFAAERLVLGQAILHEGLETKKFVSEAAKEGKLLARGGRLARYLRIVVRGLRVITKSRLFQEFQARHHLAKRGIKTRSPPGRSFKRKGKVRRG